jgi:hypothetical protein
MTENDEVLNLRHRNGLPAKQEVHSVTSPINVTCMPKGRPNAGANVAEMNLQSTCLQQLGARDGVLKVVLVCDAVWVSG